MTLQEIIQILIKKHGLTQSDIAKQCNCSQTVISLLYTGARQNTRFKTAQAFLALYREITQHDTEITEVSSNQVSV